jgi:hypothetical protein
MTESRTVVVQEFMEKSGDKDGKPWTRFAIKDANGDIYSTFKKEIIQPVRELTGQKVDITYTINGKYKNLETAQPHQGNGVPETYSSSRDGEADWDIIGLRKTRCLLWAEYLNGQLAGNVYHKATTAEGVEPRDAVLRAGSPVCRGGGA